MRCSVVMPVMARSESSLEGKHAAEADASTAWCLAQCSACAMAAAYLDRETALELFGPPGRNRGVGTTGTL